MQDKDHDQNQSEDDIRALGPGIARIILMKWRIEKKDLRQIADELKLPIEEVQGILTRIQKSIIRKGS